MINICSCLHTLVKVFFGAIILCISAMDLFGGKTLLKRELLKFRLHVEINVVWKTFSYKLGRDEIYKNFFHMIVFLLQYNV